jgi:hypothetical protein
MKLKALLVATTIALSTSAFAQWFQPRVNVLVLPFQVTAEVINPFAQPVICNGQVFGQTAHGLVLNTFFVEQFLPMGSNRFAYVNTNIHSPFVAGWANIHCRYAPFF